MARRTNPSMRETYANVKQKASTLKSLTKQGVAAMKKHRDAEKKGLHHTVCNDCGAEDSAFVTMAGLRVPTDICTVCGGRGQAIVYRDNASFTLDQTYGSGHGDRTLIQAFYQVLNERFRGNTPVPIPPESQVHPKHDAETQTFIFVDFAVRKIAPIALRYLRSDAVLKAQAKALEQLKPLIDLKSAESTDVKSTLDNAYDAATDFDNQDEYDSYYGIYYTVYEACEAHRDGTRADYTADDRAFGAAEGAARAVSHIAEWEPDETWAVVNEMLQAL